LTLGPEQLAIEKRAVGGRLPLLTIPPAGSIKQELIDPEQYVADHPAPGVELLTCRPESGAIWRIRSVVEFSPSRRYQKRGDHFSVELLEPRP